MYRSNDNTRSSAVSPVRAVTLFQWSLYLISRTALAVRTMFCKTWTQHQKDFKEISFFSDTANLC
jgi:hypothetical protein